ncbi:MAG: PD-(D/E)XK nuclease family protein [Candidatus Micrarchaeia archaeon]
MQESSTLKKLGKSSISATDLASQFWCEKQMELNYLYGRKYTEEMRKGRQMHADLQAEVFVPLNIEPVTYADFLYKTGYEDYMALKTLGQKGVCRELRIYGSVSGYRIVGQIDELRMEDGKVRILELKTVQPNGAKPAVDSARAKPHIVQIMTYKKLLEDIRSGRYTLRNFSNSYGIKEKKVSDTFARALHAIGVKDELFDLEKIYGLVFDEIRSLPEISEKLEIYYIDRFTGMRSSSIIINYDEKKIYDELVFAMQYWSGKREALPVSKDEVWKCNLCKFYGKECTVWWPKPGKEERA